MSDSRIVANLNQGRTRDDGLAPFQREDAQRLGEYTGQRLADERHMRFAISRARLGSLPAGQHPLDQSHRPFGCVIVDEGGAVIAYAEGSERFDDPTWHSEMEAIRLACRRRGGLLHGCTLYSTAEPCLMCCGAILHAKLTRVVWGSSRIDLPDLFRVRAPVHNAIHLLEDTGHPPEVEFGVCRDECVALFNAEMSALRRGREHAAGP